MFLLHSSGCDLLSVFCGQRKAQLASARPSLVSIILCYAMSCLFDISDSYGFEFIDHPWMYVSFILITIPHMLLVTLIYYGTDILFINILLYCTAYMKYVQSEVECLKDDLETFLTDDDAIRKRICKIVEVHQKGLEFAGKLEEVLNLIMLVLYTVSTMVLCFLFFEFHIVSYCLIGCGVIIPCFDSFSRQFSALE